MLPVAMASGEDSLGFRWGFRWVSGDSCFNFRLLFAERRISGFAPAAAARNILRQVGDDGRYGL